jgi:glycosyltransferase involved in cell wall biosynthesis
VFNGGTLLTQAIASVCAQDMADMEVIVLDDGSSDGSWDLITASNDQRIRGYRHPNMGLAATLNRGISLAQGRYIARQDQDDLLLPGRIAKQAAFLDAHPEIAMVGTWSQIYSGDSPTERFHRHPSSNAALQLELLFDNPFVHSSMMIRAGVLREVGGYCEDRSRQPPEDYELWSRIARRHPVANLPEVLTVYREVQGSMSRTGDNPFLSNVIRISAENLTHLLAPRYSPEDCASLANLYHRGGAEGFRMSLTKVAARQMLEFAATELSGEKADWSEEFAASYRRMRAHLDSRFLRGRIPAPLLGPARWFRNQVLRRGRQ